MAYKRVAGIYKITSPSGEVYIGQSVNLSQRFAIHKAWQKKGSTRLLRNSFLKHGFENHTFSIIHYLPQDVSKEIMINYEQLYMDCYRDCGVVLLNASLFAYSTKGLKPSEEALKNMSIAGKGKKKGPMSDEHRANLSQALKGTKSSVGRVLSEETKQKIANSLKGNKPWNAGKTGVYSEEARNKISETLKRNNAILRQQKLSN